MFRVDCGLKVDEEPILQDFLALQVNQENTQKTWQGNCNLGNLKSFRENLHKKTSRPPLEAVCFGGFGVFIWRSRKEDLHHRHRQEQRLGLSDAGWI